MKKLTATELIDKFNNGTASDEEKAILEKWYLQQKPSNELPVIEHLLADQYRSKKILMQEIGAGRKFKLWPRLATAASIIIVIGAGLWFYRPAVILNLFQSLSRSIGDPKALAMKNDIPPGGNHATLTVDGEIIPLSDTQSGIVMSDKRFAYNDGTSLGRHSRNGFGTSSELVSGPHTDKAIKNITATTPKGGMYQITLPDNTKVWLNNDSKLEFASNFGKTSQRIVDLTGEAYFEVTENKAMPFIVKSDGQQVTVLGTHFNVSAYKGEGIKTTLLEGSVRVANTPRHPELVSELAPMNRGPRTSNEVTLKPNRQSLVTANQPITVKEVDVSEAVAWKNGLFKFKDADLETVMKQIARWYNIQVVYQNGIPKGKITGEVYRNMNASKVLEVLKSLDITFKIEGNKIIVMQ